MSDQCTKQLIFGLVLCKKCNLEKVDGSAQKSRGRPVSRPHRPFWGPLGAILDFAGGAVLQAVWRCRRCDVAGSAALQAVDECPLRR